MTTSLHSAADIADTIKNFPLDKPKDVPLKEAKKNSTNSFDKRTKEELETLAFEQMALESHHSPTQKLHDFRQEVIDLRTALDTLAKGKPPLGTPRAALKDALNIVERLARLYDYLGGRAQENSVAPDAFLRQQIAIFAHLDGVGIEKKQAQVAEMESHVASLYALQAHNLRHEVNPLFRELAKSLHMRLNPPSKGRGA